MLLITSVKVPHTSYAWRCGFPSFVTSPSSTSNYYWRTPRERILPMSFPTGTHTNSMFFALFTRYRGLSSIEIHHTRGAARKSWCYDPRPRSECRAGGRYWDTAHISAGLHCMRQYGLQETALWIRGALIHWIVRGCLSFHWGEWIGQGRLPYGLQLA